MKPITYEQARRYIIERTERQKPEIRQAPLNVYEEYISWKCREIPEDQAERQRWYADEKRVEKAVKLQEQSKRWTEYETSKRFRRLDNLNSAEHRRIEAKLKSLQADCDRQRIDVSDKQSYLDKHEEFHSRTIERRIITL